MSEIPTPLRETAEKLADDILKAAGSGFQHYMPSSKGKIVSVAADFILADRQRDQWQPIETAPKDGTTVLLFAPGWGSPNTGWRFAEDAWQDCPYSPRGDGSYEPTHWQPLPAAPKGE